MAYLYPKPLGNAKLLGYCEKVDKRIEICYIEYVEFKKLFYFGLQEYSTQYELFN